MTDAPTQFEVWDWLREHGESSLDEIVDGLDSDRRTVKRTIRSLSHSGHVSLSLERGFEANPTDELRPLCGPFGAGAGEVVAGEEPPDEPL